MTAARNRENAITLGLFFFALLFALFYQTHAIVSGPIRQDAAQYVKLAINLLVHHTLSMDDPGSVTVRPDSYRPPGYPLLIAIIFWVTEGKFLPWYHAVLTIQALMLAATVALTFRISRRFMGLSFSVFCAALLSVWPLAIVQSGYVLTETFFGFLLTVAIWLQCISVQRRSLPAQIFSALFYAGASLVNPMIVPFFICVAGLLFLTRRHSLALMFVAVAFLPAICWQFRDSNLPPGQASSGHRFAENILTGMDSEIKRYYNDRSSIKGAIVFSQFHADMALYDNNPKQFYDILFKRLKDNPYRYLSIYFLEKPRDVWYWGITQGQGGLYVYPVLNSPYASNFIYRVTGLLTVSIEPIILLLALVGVFKAVLMLRRLPNEMFPAIVVAMLFVYVSVFYDVLAPDGRYATPFRGIEFMTGMLGLSWLVAIYVTKRSKHFRIGSVSS